MVFKLLEKLADGTALTKEEYLILIQNKETVAESAAGLAGKVRQDYYGNVIYIRGLIEFTNYCRNNCYY